MAVVLVVQMTIHQIVDVVAVGNGFVTAARSMNVTRVVGRAFMTVCAIGCVIGVYIQGMFVYVIAVDMMQVTVMQKIDVVAVLDGGVTTAGAVLMVVIFVFLAFRHRCLLQDDD